MNQRLVRSRPPAFTLFELMLVMALIVILGALSYPTFQSMVGGFRAQAAVDAVRASWAQARAKAMNDGVPYRFSVAPGKGNYRVAPDTPEFWLGNEGTPKAADPASPPLVLEQTLPKTVRFSTPSAVQAGERAGNTEDTSAPIGSTDPTAWSTVVVFLPDGTARADAELAILASGARPMLLRLRGLTGVVTTGPL
jgi:prepilin-type N-terminal cleavage/methylation domain-containing protein